MSENSQTREQHKAAQREEKEQQKVEATASEGRKGIRVRLIPLWLRLILLAIFIVLFVILGAMFGYSVIGDGKPLDIFHKSTWTYIQDLIIHK